MKTLATRVPSRASLLRLCGAAGLLVGLVACSVARSDEQKGTIVVGGDVNHSAVHELKKARGREPTRQELLGLHRVWIDNEILYREGLKLPDSGDSPKSREQVVARMLAGIDEKLRPAAVPEQELRAWFESRRAKYEQPARFDYEDATPAGTRSEADVSALAEKLNAGTPAAPASLRAFKGRPESNLLQSYGPEVAGALARAEPGTWLSLRARDAPLPSSPRARLVRLLAGRPNPAARSRRRRRRGYARRRQGREWAASRRAGRKRSG